LLYRKSDSERAHEAPPSNLSTSESYRTPYRRDYARLIHSAAFRRLEGKTQLFPGIESDFFRNRITHSIEVAQIAKSIAIKLNNTEQYFKTNNIDLDLIETAGLAHDLGHPPFGHNGELALDHCMKRYGGFEGNAQTLRILTVLEKKEPIDASPYGVAADGVDKRAGLNLTYRTLAATLKYDKKIPVNRQNKKGLEKGYYESESNLVKTIKEKVTEKKGYRSKFKTIECQIMDIADDIAYSTYDLEDALKAGFVTPLDMISSNKALLTRISRKVTDNFKKLGIKKAFSAANALETLLDIFISQKIFDLESLEIDINQVDINHPYSIALLVGAVHRASIDLGRIGYLRTQFTSDLVGQFINGVKVEINKSNPALSKAYLDNDVLKKVEVLKHFNYEAIIQAPRLKVVEYRGYDIVKTIFDALASTSPAKGYQLLPDDFRAIHDRARNKKEKMRTICDFVAGMTNRYAVEFYARLKSENAQTIFKPF